MRVFSFFAVLLVVSCVHALWRGGRAEQVFATGYVVGVILTHFAISPGEAHYRGAELGVLMVDSLFLLFTVAIALVSTRFWPMWLAAIQALPVISQLAVMMPGVANYTYWNAIVLWSYPTLFILMVATERHQRRLRRHGHDSSWRSFSFRSSVARPAA